MDTLLKIVVKSGGHKVAEYLPSEYEIFQEDTRDGWPDQTIRFQYETPNGEKYWD